VGTSRLEHPQHPIVRVGSDLVYFDTGSPVSIVPAETTHVFSALGVAPPSMIGIMAPAFQQTWDTVNHLTGKALDGLIGMDVISQTGLLYDRPGGRLAWGEAAVADTDSIELESTTAQGLPVVTMEIAGRRMRVIADTGCHEDGYLLDLPSNLPEAGRIRDANPIIGEFEAQARVAPAKIVAADGSTINLGEGRFGEAPPLVALTLRAVGVEGVVGAVVIQRFALLPRISPDWGVSGARLFLLSGNASRSNW